MRLAKDHVVRKRVVVYWPVSVEVVVHVASNAAMQVDIKVAIDAAAKAAIVRV